MKKMMKKQLSFVLMVLLPISFIFVSCSSDDNPVSPVVEKTEFEMIQPAADTYVAGSLAPVLTAQSLFDNINDGNTSNDFVVLSVRGAADYAKGHIPGAINIPWREIAKEANLSLLSKSQPIAVYCYTGHTGSIATTLLNTLGYEAYNIKWGMMSWTKDQGVRVASAFNESVDAHDFAIETAENTATQTYDLAVTDFSTATDDQTVLLAAADYVATNITAATSAQTLFDNLMDGNASNDPIVVSVRSAADYAKGHIPGAINIPWKEIAKEDNLKKLDPNKEIVVYCYTGHTGGVAAAALNLLGYKATNLKFGIMSWTKDATVRVSKAFDESVDAHDFQVTSGSQP